jgi:hypothetical protein
MRNQKGFFIIFLDILFVILGLVLLIIGLLTNRDILAQLPAIFKR